MLYCCLYVITDSDTRGVAGSSRVRVWVYVFVYMWSRNYDIISNVVP